MSQSDNSHASRNDVTVETEQHSNPPSELVDDSEPERVVGRSSRRRSKIESKIENKLSEVSDNDDGQTRRPKVAQTYLGSRSLATEILAADSRLVTPARPHTQASPLHRQSNDEETLPALFTDTVMEFETDYEPFNSLRRKLANYVRLFRNGDFSPDDYYRMTTDTMTQGKKAYHAIHEMNREARRAEKRPASHVSRTILSTPTPISPIQGARDEEAELAAALTESRIMHQQTTAGRDDRGEPNLPSSSRAPNQPTRESTLEDAHAASPKVAQHDTATGENAEWTSESNAPPAESELRPWQVG